MKTRIEAFFLWIYFFFGNHRKQWSDQMEIYQYAYSKQVEELNKLVQYTDGQNSKVVKAHLMVLELTGKYRLLEVLLTQYPNLYSIAKQIIVTTNEAESIEKSYNAILSSIDIK
jgi:hypothetical protein